MVHRPISRPVVLRHGTSSEARSHTHAHPHIHAPWYWEGCSHSAQGQRKSVRMKLPTEACANVAATVLPMLGFPV